MNPHDITAFIAALQRAHVFAGFKPLGPPIVNLWHRSLAAYTIEEIEQALDVVAVMWPRDLFPWRVLEVLRVDFPMLPEIKAELCRIAYEGQK